MSRNAAPGARPRRTSTPFWDQSTFRTGAIVGVLTLATVVVIAGPSKLFGIVTGQGACSGKTVTVAVAPEMAATVAKILDPVTRGDDPQAGCVEIKYDDRPSGVIALSSKTATGDAIPDIWVSDSSYWLNHSPGWKITKAGNLASSPVVLAASKSAVTKRTWDTEPPTWAQALGSDQPLAIPNATTHIESLLGYTNLWIENGRDYDGNRALASAHLNSARVSGLEASAGLPRAMAGEDLAPLVPVSEHVIYEANQKNPQSAMVAVYPSDGSPMLDFPVATVIPEKSSAGFEANYSKSDVDFLIGKLTSAEAHSAAAAAGFRADANRGPDGLGITSGPVKTQEPPANEDVEFVYGRIDQLNHPMRVLAMLDVSDSMAAKIKGGASRIDLATLTAKRGAELLADSSWAGLWAFGENVRDNHDVTQLSPVLPLGQQLADGKTQRDDLLGRSVDDIGGLKPGSTAMYESISTGTDVLHRYNKPGIFNVIVVFTDGRDDSGGKFTKEALITKLREVAVSDQPVAVFGIGIGPDADLTSLDEVSKASGGKAYRVNSVEEIQNALLDGLAFRSYTPPK